MSCGGGGVFVRVSSFWCVRSGVSCVRVCEACELHERSPSPNFAERTPDETTSSKNKDTSTFYFAF